MYMYTCEHRHCRSIVFVVLLFKKRDKATSSWEQLAGCSCCCVEQLRLTLISFLSGAEFITFAALLYHCQRPTLSQSHHYQREYCVCKKRQKWEAHLLNGEVLIDRKYFETGGTENYQVSAFLLIVLRFSHRHYFPPYNTACPLGSALRLTSLSEISWIRALLSIRPFSRII